MTLQELREIMETYNRDVAPGSECNAWGDFVEDCYDKLGCSPWDDNRQTEELDRDFAAYWVRVAAVENEDYNAAGDRVSG
jgi:hypothetical protein